MESPEQDISEESEIAHLTPNNFEITRRPLESKVMQR